MDTANNSKGSIAEIVHVSPKCKFYSDEYDWMNFTISTTITPKSIATTLKDLTPFNYK